MAQQSPRLSTLRAKPDVQPIAVQRPVCSWLERAEKAIPSGIFFCTTVFTVKPDTWNEEGMLEPQNQIAPSRSSLICNRWRQSDGHWWLWAGFWPKARDDEPKIGDKMEHGAVCYFVYIKCTCFKMSFPITNHNLTMSSAPTLLRSHNVVWDHTQHQGAMLH